MSSAWNLLEDVAAVLPGQKFFSLPLAAAVPPSTEPTIDDAFALSGGLPPLGTYSFTETHTASAPVPDSSTDRTIDVPLKILIKEPPGGFPTDPDHPALPPPAIRLHAVAKGNLTYITATNQLVLTTKSFTLSQWAGALQAHWWPLWLEAHCVPEVVIYDNVDVTHLRTFLKTVPFAPDETLFGLKFPGPLADAGERDAFVDNFLDHNPGPGGPLLMTAKAGSAIGQVDKSLSDVTKWELTLRVRYQGHATGAELPMNPRELLHAMFGQTSPVAAHPLLKDLDGSALGPLRPPLRTWRRLMWEAEQEAARQAAAGGTAVWSAAGTVNSTFLFDRVFSRKITTSDPPRFVSYNNLTDNKCNVFTSEMCLKAGFRAMILPNPTLWHYQRANQHSHVAVNVLKLHPADAPARYPVMGQGVDNQRVWGYVLSKLITTNQLNEQGITDLLNDMMLREGRALIVACARPRPRDASGNVKTDTNGNPLSGTGHIVLAREFTFDPDPTKDRLKLLANNDSAVPANTTPGVATKTIAMMTLKSAQANSTLGAVSNHDFTPHFGGAANNASSGSQFIRIHVLEAAPGQDPDLLQGLRDLHVLRADTEQFSTSLD